MPSPSQHDQPLTLDGQRILVTGGARRLGAAICRTFAQAGARVAIHYHRSRDEAQLLLAELGGTQAGHRLCPGDLRQLADLPEILASAGPLDLLINNAAIYRPRPLAEEPLAEAMDQFVVNFWAPLALMQAFRQQAQAGAAIINLLDQRIALPAIADGSYSLSKKALAEATLAAARQWGPLLRVNAVAPGAVLPPPELPHANLAQARQEMPLARPPDPAAIADACRYLAVNQALTGQIIYVDGGQHLTAGVALRRPAP